MHFVIACIKQSLSYIYALSNSISKLHQTLHKHLAPIILPALHACKYNLSIAPLQVMS
jgi:hypothetical protein